MNRKKIVKRLFFFIAFGLLVYGCGRLYFRITDGFRIAHISSDFSYDPRWETRPLSSSEQSHLADILSQKFTYLGKGCQSYVFASEDGQYVVKFLKYQRFRPQFYMRWYAFLPPGKRYLERKIAHKTAKRENLFSSWVTAFNHLQPETGLVYVHLNKTAHLDQQMEIVDKVGRRHVLDMDEMEFLVQERAAMLCPTLDNMVAEGKEEEAKGLLTSLIQMVISEYHRGLADLDHALMQNTGVYRGRPVHVDVGQFVKDDAVSEPTYYYQELFNKTWKFRNWLREQHPALLEHVDAELIKEMGERFYQIHYIPKEH